MLYKLHVPFLPMLILVDKELVPLTDVISSLDETNF